MLSTVEPHDRGWETMLQVLDEQGDLIGPLPNMTEDQLVSI
jgi:hypothetical protein